jgi:hypothetical protein
MAEMASKINNDFSTIKDRLSKKLKEVFKKNTLETFLVYLTSYGAGGSYNPPNVIVFNINNKGGLKTIIHEIIHLLIEDQVQKYKIQHWEKERIVDLIMNSKEFDFLKYNFWQRDYAGAEKYIDKLFDDYFFKNQKNFFSNIAAARATFLKN